MKAAGPATLVGSPACQGYDKSAVDNLEQLIMDLKESLAREFREGLKGFERKMDQGFAQINSRFDLQAARLDRLERAQQNGKQ